jgi:stage III sporulation protein SpoIIIAA
MTSERAMEDLDTAASTRPGNDDDLEELFEALPPAIVEPLRALPPERRELLIEIVMDLGRRPEARFVVGEMELLDREVVEADIQYVIERVGSFGDDNRAGIERTLHRISAIRNRSGKIVGLTCRFGRAVFGTIEIARDIVESGRSILIMGRPGIGKTTMLREAARVLADELDKRVVVVDTSNEIAGDGDIPHPGIGRARRMQVRTPALQHEVMIEAVENHMPEVIVIDEIGTEREAAAARTIAERGVQLIGTAHGNNLDNLMVNPTLSDLIGGIQSVTLGDEEARRRRTQKSVLERKAPPTFDVVMEIQDRDRVIVHQDVAETVDALLRGDPIVPELRYRDETGVHRAQTRPRTAARELTGDRFSGVTSGPSAPWRGEAGYRGDPGWRGETGWRAGSGWRADGGTRGRRTGGARASGGTPRSAGRQDDRPQAFELSAREDRELRRQEAWGASAARALRTLGGAEADIEMDPDAPASVATAVGPLEPMSRPGESAELLADSDGRTPSQAAIPSAPGAALDFDESQARLPTLRVLGFSISRKRLEQAIRELALPVEIVNDIDEADIVMTLRHAYRQKAGALRDAEERAIPIYVLKSNTVLQMEACLTSLYSIEVDPREAALRETEEAIGLVMRSAQPVELSPQNAYIRRLQHQMAERSNVVSQSRGREPHRHVRLYPDRPRVRR